VKRYDPLRPLISFHIPRCAGTSFRETLLRWFGEKLVLHYCQEGKGVLPPVHPIGPGTCVHGHFQHQRGFGVEDYYPRADQFIAILRNPLEQAVSHYFYMVKALNSHKDEFFKIDYDIQKEYFSLENFLKSNCSLMLEYMPFNHRWNNNLKMTMENHREILDEYFVYIGIVEDIGTSLKNLAALLGFPESSVVVEKHNAAQRFEQPSQEAVDAFMEQNRLEYAIYDYALKTYNNADTLEACRSEVDLNRYIAGIESALKVKDNERLSLEKDLMSGIRHMEKILSIKEGEIAAWEKNVKVKDAYIEELHRRIKNPFY